MRIIEVKALENGGHRNQTGSFSTIPEGFAVIPDNMETANFPFGEAETEEINGVLTVTKWTPGMIPEPEPEPETEPTTEELVNILLGVTK
jgi:hypothetical protein